MRALEAYHWPGNVRELENVLDRAFALGVGNMLTIRDLPSRFRDSGEMFGPDDPRPTPPPVILDALPPGQNFDKQGYERQAMVLALSQCGGNKIDAARSLRMSRSTFYRKYKEYGITDEERVELI